VCIDAQACGRVADVDSQIKSVDASLEAYEMPKPKGMWWRTFYRLQEAAQAAENRAADDFIIAAGPLVTVG